MDLITGAFGNLGQAIADLLGAQGRSVRTLTNHDPTRPGAADSPLEVWPYSFDEPDRMTPAFEGVTTFYNTFWMRTGDESGFTQAVARSKALLAAAERAGVAHIVQVSVAGADAPEAARYPYFRAKAQVEQAVAETGIPATIVRPSLIFGGESVLFNNLAWVLRKLPVFVVPRRDFRIRPVHIRDLAELCVQAANDGTTGVVDAVGPDRPTFAELVTQLRDGIGRKTPIVRLPTPLVLAGAKALGLVLSDQVLTRDELLSSLDGLADTSGPATGQRSLSQWIDAEAHSLGRGYINESRRR